MEPTDENIFKLENLSVEQFRNGDLKGALKTLRQCIDMDQQRIKAINLSIKMSMDSIKERENHILHMWEKIGVVESFMANT